MKNKKIKNNNEKDNNKILLISFGVLLGLFLLITLIVVLNKDNKNLNYTTKLVSGNEVYNIEDHEFIESDKETDLVKIEVDNYGIMIAELYPDIAPITVKNFKKLVGKKFYDGLIFHRVIKDFMIQTGDPTGTGTGGSDEKIKGEFSLNGVENNLSHKRGVLSMARAGSVPETEETLNSASSQIFIMHKDNESLDGSYAAFGKVLYGFDVIDKVANVSTNENDKPYVDQVIKSIRFVSVFDGIGE